MKEKKSKRMGRPRVVDDGVQICVTISRKAVQSLDAKEDGRAKTARKAIHKFLGKGNY